MVFFLIGFLVVFDGVGSTCFALRGFVLAGFLLRNGFYDDYE
jgi:hypothetical protein